MDEEYRDRVEIGEEEIPIEEFSLEDMDESAPSFPEEAPAETAGKPQGKTPEAAVWTEEDAIPPEPVPEYAGRYGLLDRRGRLAHTGWNTRDEYEYNKENMRQAFRRKEWEFNQLSNSRFVFQVTYGHTGYAALAGATLVDFATGERYSSGRPRLFPGDRLDLDFSGGQPQSLKYEDGDLFLSISFDGDVRRLLVRSDRFDADISCHDAGDAIVTVTPFALRGQFYYNYKKVFRDLAGHVQVNRASRALDGETFLLLDSGRGIWPYRNRWIWASGATETDRGVLALNLGGGFGAEGAPTENAIFLDGRIQKLGKVYFKFVPDDPMRLWHISDDRRRLRLTFHPTFDNYTQRNALLVRTRCHQVFGKLSGTVELEDGTVLRLTDVPFFCEHAVNRW